MVNPCTDTDPLQQHPFTKGAPVEVSSDGEGFRGAWYSATILESSTNSTFKRRNKALIKYNTLLADDGSSPLTEHVDPAHIRPLPPNHKGGGCAHRFEVNDVVDACYRDGWWTGIVSKVLEKSKYRVYFDNPPDVIEFHRKDLRVHWNWIPCKWVRPEKQKSTGAIFSSGTDVEVNIENENRGDIWYPALVVKENEDNTFLVKYQNSGTDDESGTGTVKVVVDSLHIRPITPQYADRNYEFLERVDATYNFGWQSGVITKVLTGKRYNVFFKNGNEDKEFCHSDIRPSVEWIDGKWEVITESDEQEQIGIALCTQKSKLVAELESSLYTKENCEDKTSLTKMNKNAVGKSTSTYENNALNTSKKKVKPETSNGKTPRSRPLKKLTEVNAVETPVSVTCGKLKDTPSETLCKEGTPTSGKGAKSSRKAVVGDELCAKIESPTTRSKTQTASNDCLFCQHHHSNRTTKRQKADSADGTANNLVKRNARASKSPSKGPQVPTAGKDGTTWIAEGSNEREIKTKEVEMPIVIGLPAFKKTLQAENSLQIPSEETLKLMGDQKNNLNENMETKEHKVGASHLKRKRGRPDRSVGTSPKAFDAGKEQNGAGGITDEKVVKDCTSDEAGLSKHKGVEVSATEDSQGRTSDDYKTKEVHMAVPGNSDMADEDQPLSTWIGGMHTSGDEGSRLPSARLVIGWNEEKGLADVPIESLANDASGRSPLVNDQSLPFVKRSPVWRTIESMDVFQIVPQKPHFLPLAENREEFREGSAVGIMVTFTNLFEKISMLHFDEPRDTFNSILESLSDLEKHGFDVTRLRHCSNKLLSLKEGHSQHLGERQNAEREIIENTKEISKFDEEMEEIEKKISQLQKRHASIKSEKETKNLKVGNLKLHASFLNKLIQNAPHDFKKLATASWKLP